MIKPAGLRAAIVAAIPSLGSNPDKLTVFIDQGSIAATGARSLSFEYRYVCNVLLLDFGGDPDALFVALLDWVRHNQPDLVLNPDEHASGITYEIDVLNNKTADVSIKVQLTEGIVVKVDDNGKRIVEHVDDSKLQDVAGPWVDEPWMT